MINEERWYTITELLSLAKDGLLPYKSRSTWLELIKSGKLKAIEKGESHRKTYMLQGTDIIAYLDGIKIRQR